MKCLFREAQEVERRIEEMRASKVSLQLAALVMLFFLLACAPTKFSTIWKDETYHSHPKKILVINAFPNPANRRLFEDEFVKALKDRKTDAVASYTVMPEPVVSDKEAIAAQAKEVGADTVLISTPLGETTGETLGAGGVVYKELYINTQTDVYDMKLNRLVLSTTAETWIQPGKPYPSQIQAYVKTLVLKLSEQGLF
jgi:hypothetical protein